MASDFPEFSFPPIITPDHQYREIFGYYGTYRHMHYETETGMLSQNLRGNVTFSAAQPVLPLAVKPESVKFPLVDRVMGNLIKKNKTIKRFIMHSKKRQSILKGKMCIKAKDYIADIQAQAREQKKNPTCRPESLLAVVPKDQIGVRALFNDYMLVADEERLQLTNSNFNGGCLGHLGRDADQHYLISPTGQKFKTINVCQVSEETDNLLSCETVQEFKLPQSVYGIHCDTVQGQGYAAIRGASRVHLYSLSPDNSDCVLSKLQETRLDGKRISSVKLSPYIPGECLVTTAGQCYLWSGDKLDNVLGPIETHFKVNDPWCTAQFGAHPRQLVYTDQTAIQLKDLRSPTSEELDLFALPTNLLHVTERIRLCERYPASSFCHLVGTDFTMFLVDERFAKNPVLQFNHMLAMPPQYCGSLRQSEPDSNNCLVYVGSQYPADMHGVQLTTREGTPTQQLTVPWRAAKITWEEFVSQCTNPQMLKQRLEGSLAGIQAVPWKNGHAVFQLNCNGEIFHQVFQPSSGGQDVTFSAGLGSHDLTPPPESVRRAQQWISAWEKQMFTKDRTDVECYSAPVENVFAEVRVIRRPDPSCVACNADQSHSNSQSTGGTPEADDRDEEDEGEKIDEICGACGLILTEGKQLKQNTISLNIPSVSYDVGNFLGHLYEPEDLPATKATTQLLIKQWQKDEDVAELLQERDKEALDTWKAWKEGQKMKKADAPSLLDRLSKKINVGRSSEKAADGDTTQAETTEMEEELEMVSEAPLIDFQSDSDNSTLEFLLDEGDESSSKKEEEKRKKKGDKDSVSYTERSNDSDMTHDEETERESVSKTNNGVHTPRQKKSQNNNSVLSPNNHRTMSQAGGAYFKSPERAPLVRTNSVASDISLFQSQDKHKTNSVFDTPDHTKTSYTSDSDQSVSLLTPHSKQKRDKRERSESASDTGVNISNLTRRSPDRDSDASSVMMSPRKKLKSSVKKKTKYTVGF